MCEEEIKDLLNWYKKNKRDLPFRHTKDPYAIFVSEIMLQQTRVETVIPYFEKFMKRLPTIEDLGKIKEEELLKLWEGLGYYSRVKNMQKCAKILISSNEKTFPSTYQKLLKLPGIGPYTAGAIASIAFGEKVSAVDGNVLRVVLRLKNMKDDISKGTTRKKVEDFLNEKMPEESGEFNQALMELGSTICIPKNPRCNICPMQKWCQGYKKGTSCKLPIKSKKQKQEKEEKTIFLFLYKNQIAIQKRPNKGLLASLWEFPNQPMLYSIKEIKQKFPCEKVIKTENYIHVFSHKIWNMQGYIVFLKKPIEDYVWVSFENLIKDYSLPSAFQYFIKEIEKNKMK